MQLLDDDEELAYHSKKEKMTQRQTSLPDARPAWMRQLHKSVTEWLKMVPQVCCLIFCFNRGTEKCGSGWIEEA